MDKTFPSVKTSWSPALVVDIALNETSLNGAIYDTEELCSIYGLTLEEFQELRGIEAFKRDVRDAIIEVKQNGLTPKKKMALMYEYIMDTKIPQWLDDADFPPTEKVKIWAHLGKGSGLLVDKPAEEKDAGKGATQQPSINIILTNSTPIQSVQVTQNEPITIDQEKE